MHPARCRGEAKEIGPTLPPGGRDAAGGNDMLDLLHAAHSVIGLADKHNPERLALVSPKHCRAVTPPIGRPRASWMPAPRLSRRPGVAATARTRSCTARRRHEHGEAGLHDQPSPNTTAHRTAARIEAAVYRLRTIRKLDHRAPHPDPPPPGPSNQPANPRVLDDNGAKRQNIRVRPSRPNKIMNSLEDGKYSMGSTYVRQSKPTLSWRS
ncbi:hypothetical protein GCM10010412_098300 [Nonomuraea recticatena]|uniref:Uncharacterized protein n=1 Tax=Nonomuraea recticatena TaxID=46178 RepID=A0ABN3TEK5_9ACTN